MSARLDGFHADAKLVAAAVRAEADRAAYLATGGSDGCSLCKGLTFGERVEKGHPSCAEALAATKGANATAAGMSEVWIAICRAMTDPRFGEWLRGDE